MLAGMASAGCAAMEATWASFGSWISVQFRGGVGSRLKWSGQISEGRARFAAASQLLDQRAVAFPRAAMTQHNIYYLGGHIITVIHD
jgi:hypothetical protein